MRKENLFKNKATKGLVAALAVAMATTIVPVNADAAAAKKVTIAKGDSVKKAGKKGSFKSNKTKVAKVSKNGKITAVKAGKAKITAKTAKGKKVTYTVTVKKAPTISKKKVSVTAGNSKKVTVNKNGAKYLKVSFKSSNKSVATVNKNGKITGVAAGTATVTATVKGKTKNYKLKVAVTVKAADVTNPDDNNPDDNKPDNPDVTDKNPVITQATNLAAGTYETVTVKSSVPEKAVVSLGTAKIGTLYVESGTEYNLDASQAEIDTIEIVGSGQAAAKDNARVAKAPWINFGNNAKLTATKLVAKASAYLAGTAKLASVEVPAAVSLHMDIKVGTVSITGNTAAVSMHGAVDELVITGETTSVGIFASVTTVKVEGKKAKIVVAATFKVASMVITGTEAQVVGNGTVEDLKINAASAVIQTAVTKAVIDASVTDGAMIGGVKRPAGTEVNNVSAVANQKDEDPVNLVTDTTTPTNPTNPVTPGGSNGGGSTVTTENKTASAFVNKKTNQITLYAGGQTIVITKENLKRWLTGQNAALPASENINNRYGVDGKQYLIASVDNQTFYIPTGAYTLPETPGNSITNVDKEIVAKVGMYEYNLKVKGINNPGDDDAAVIIVTGHSIPVGATFTLTPDNKVTSYNAVVKSGSKKATITYESNGTTDEVVVNADDVKKLYNSGMAGSLDITVNGKAEKAILTTDVKNITPTTTSLVAYAYTVPKTDTMLVLGVSSISGTQGNYSANIEVVALDQAGTTGNLKIVVE